MSLKRRTNEKERLRNRTADVTDTAFERYISTGIPVDVAIQQIIYEHGGILMSLEAITTDMASLQELMIAVEKISGEYGRQTEAVDGGKLRAYRAIAYRHDRELAKLQEKSLQTRYQTEFGIMGGSLIQRSITSFRTGLKHSIEFTKTRNAKHRDAATDCMREAAQTAELLQKLIKRLESPDHRDDDAGLSV